MEEEDEGTRRVWERDGPKLRLRCGTRPLAAGARGGLIGSRPTASPGTAPSCALSLPAVMNNNTRPSLFLAPSVNTTTCVSFCSLK